MRKVTRIAFVMMIFLLISGLLINVHILNKAKDLIYHETENTPEKQAVIILGAYVRGETLSHVLEQRVKSGVDIYLNGKVSKILLSGDHGQSNYDEVNSMRKYILENYSKVREYDIFMDHAGFDTYDSMYRARDIFKIENAVVVTQAFHVDRAVYIANELGIEAVGYAVNEDMYPLALKCKWRLRESLARIKAYGNIAFKSKPRFLGESIPITGNGKLSWDDK